MPGETIRILDGEIYIDGEVIADREGLKSPSYAGRAEYEITLGSDEYFVLGDNREESIDSRYEEVGNVKCDTIVGRAVFLIYPFQKVGLVN